jgi:DNA-directed RNA polymerase specialized sigma24 family protein
MDPRAREPDPATMARLADLAELRRGANRMADYARRALQEGVRLAKAEGHSYSQIQKATGLSLGAVQRMVK